MNFVKKGRCLCGDIAYRVNDEPLFTHACHCTNCQKITGTAFWLSMFVLGKDFEITSGQPSTVCPPQQHGVAVKHYCPHCGCNVYGTHTYLPGLILPATGTFDDTTWFSPQAHIYVRSKQPWVKITDSKPQFERLYNRKSVWPKDSLQRLDQAQYELENAAD